MSPAARSNTSRVGLLAKEDPPPKAHRGSMTAEVLALVPELRGHLGEWFRIGEFAGGSTAGTLAKKLKDTYPGKIEVQAVRVEGGGSTLHARWVGNRGGADR